MSHYYGSRYRGYRYRGYHNPPSKFSRLTHMFGDAVTEIRQAFLHLPEDAVDELLGDYASMHGDGPAKYARDTYPKWRSGATQMSGQTMERLIELVPPYLSAAQRFQLLRHVVRQHRKGGATHNIFVNRKEPDEGLRQIDADLASLKIDHALAHVPEHVMEAAQWLYDDDMTAARSMFAEADRVENETIRASAMREIALLRRAIGSGQLREASYSVEMPAGRLQIRVGTPSWCFVATVCYGETAWQTQTLRRWRDDVLSKYAAGRAFICWYYRHGPSIARMVTNRPVLRATATRVLGGVALLVRLAQERDRCQHLDGGNPRAPKAMR